ncbi:PDR/VanB family oxidoreductase [Frateuria defendens]|uniref:PDR/VanB family oxidoreductase n=1 Tax=Frateuria defendens TaxID=2219559 RepID=UPI00066FEFDD|nr:PDR/VanB family oxidoreductase [Frateuria defendens]
MTTLSVIIDTLAAQGAGNLAVHLVAADGTTLPAFEAGAHVDVHLPNGLIRQYSIASSPHQREHYVLCVRREPASRGGSAYVHDQLRVGQRLAISLPRNLFALEPAGHYLLMAGGIGITPLLAMAEALDAAGTPFELHYYVRERGHAAFARRLAAGFRHGAVHVHCDAEGSNPANRLPEGLDTPGAARRLYLCGPDGFMRYVTDTALQRGWNEAQIHREAFGPAPVPTAPAATDGAFEVELASNGQVFSVPADKTIAAVLCEAGVEVPLSCEMGMCGACLTPVVAGQADHRDTVQSEAEKASPNQYVTLCCSRSLTPRLVIGL